jgi:dethiobiotin synthetase
VKPRRRGPSICLGVTGTDTGVGKTVVSVALLALARERGFRVAAMKPAETGVARGDPASDAAALAEAAGGGDPSEAVCPYVFPDPLAPWAAARRAGKELEPAVLDQAFRSLAEGRDLVLVEGAGGLLVPLTREERFDTLFARWGARLIVVAADRLGTLNHTLLTVAAARSAGIPLAGIVVNRGAGTGQPPPEESNAHLLAELLPELPVTTFPRVPDPGDLPAMARSARESGLDRLLPGRGSP